MSSLTRQQARSRRRGQPGLARADHSEVRPGLPDGNGLGLLETLSRCHPGLSVVVLLAQELTADRRDRVAAALAKSRTNGQHFLQLLGRLLPAKENRHA